MKLTRSGPREPHSTCKKIKCQPEGNEAITKKSQTPLKKIAGRQGVQVICSAPNKAYFMCRKLNREIIEEKSSYNM